MGDEVAGRKLNDDEDHQRHQQEGNDHGEQSSDEEDRHAMSVGCAGLAGAVAPADALRCCVLADQHIESS